MNRREFLGLGVGALLVMGHTPYRQWYVYRKKRLILVASETDETSLRVGEATARVLATHLPESKAMMATTASARDIASLLKSEQLDVALLALDEAYEALHGTGPFRGSAVPLRTLAVLESSALHLVTLDESNIASVADLNGKTVGTGSRGSRVDVILPRVLEAYGVDPERDVQREPLVATQAMNALKERTVDALGWVDVVPSGVIRDLAAGARPGTKLLDHGAILPKLEARYGPVYHRMTIDRGAYADLAADVGVAAVAYLLVCREDLPRRQAYQVARALANQRKEQTSAGIGATASPTPRRASPVPLHPGALDFYEGRPAPAEGQAAR